MNKWSANYFLYWFTCSINVLDRRVAKAFMFPVVGSTSMMKLWYWFMKRRSQKGREIWVDMCKECCAKVLGAQIRVSAIHLLYYSWELFSSSEASVSSPENLAQVVQMTSGPIQLSLLIIFIVIIQLYNKIFSSKKLA